MSRKNIKDLLLNLKQKNLKIFKEDIINSKDLVRKIKYFKIYLI